MFEGVRKVTSEYVDSEVGAWQGPDGWEVAV